MIDEGYIKYQCHWVQTSALPQSQVSDLTHYRDRLHGLGLIGQYPNGIGFGNVSQRVSPQSSTFMISGTQTGHLPNLTPDHYALVMAFDPDRNWLNCQGPIQASSESLTHAVIYQTLPETQAIMHVHHAGLWQTLMHQVPTTAATISYGTPEMAWEIARLLQSSEARTVSSARSQTLIMAGHEAGLITFGDTLADAYTVLMQHYRTWKSA
ncbi:MAG: class II aldolase/adducin family protein [Cyanobacteria bacterium J06635_15]